MFNCKFSSLNSISNFYPLQLTTDTDFVLGLFDTNHMPYHIQTQPEEKPTLEEMVAKSLDILEKDRKGYFLFVEG